MTPDDDEFVVPIEPAFDLHTFQPRDIPHVVVDYIEQARLAGFTEVRLIHGRGIGFQRDVVRRTLTGLPGVLAFADAPPERGGWGATIVHLSPLND
jgi:dsDNA-specific endonuclease/ATPase MutS2